MELEKIYQAIITGRAMLITGSGAHMTALGMNGEKFPSGVAFCCQETTSTRSAEDTGGSNRNPNAADAVSDCRKK